MALSIQGDGSVMFSNGTMLLKLEKLLRAGSKAKLYKHTPDNVIICRFGNDFPFYLLLTNNINNRVGYVFVLLVVCK